MDPKCPACHAPAMPDDRHCASCGTRLPATNRHRSATPATDFYPLWVPQPPPLPARSRRGPVLKLVILSLALIAALATASYAMREFGGDTFAAVVFGDREEQASAAGPFADRDGVIADAGSGRSLGSLGVSNVVGTPTRTSAPATTPEPSATPAAAPAPSASPAATPAPPARPAVTSEPPASPAATLRLASDVPPVAVHGSSRAAAAVLAREGLPLAQAGSPPRYPGDGTGGARFHPGT